MRTRSLENSLNHSVTASLLDYSYVRKRAKGRRKPYFTRTTMNRYNPVFNQELSRFLVEHRIVINSLPFL